MEFIKKKSITTGVLLIIVLFILLCCLNDYLYFLKSKNSIEIYQELSFANDFEEVQGFNIRR